MSDKLDLSGSVAAGKATDPDMRLGAAIPAGDPATVSAVDAWPEHTAAGLGAADDGVSAVEQWPEHVAAGLSASAREAEGDAYITADEAGRDAGSNGLADDLVIVEPTGYDLPTPF